MSEKENRKYGYINKSGELIIPLQYDDANDFSEGLAWVKKGDLWGANNTQGKVIIDFKYNSERAWLLKYTNGFCCVEQDGKKFYIDREGNFAFSYYENDIIQTYDYI